MFRSLAPVWPPITLNNGEANSCSPNFSFWQIGSRTQWNPAPQLSIGADIAFTHLDTAYKGHATVPPTLYSNFSGGKTPVSFIDDQSILAGIFRVQYNFYP